MVSASYLFSFGNHLTTFVDTNLTPPTGQGRVTVVDGPFAGRVWEFPYYRGTQTQGHSLSVLSSRFATAFDKISRVGVAGQSTSNKRFAIPEQLHFVARIGPRWSAKLGDLHAWLLGAFRSFDPSADDGLSPFDRRHKFVASVVYNTNFTGLGDTGKAILNNWTIANRQHVFRIPLHCRHQRLHSSSRCCNWQYFWNRPGRWWSQRFEWIAAIWLNAKQRVPTPSIKYVDLRISRRFEIRKAPSSKYLLKALTSSTARRLPVSTIRYTSFQPRTRARTRTRLLRLSIRRLEHRVICRMDFSSASVRFS